MRLPAIPTPIHAHRLKTVFKAARNLEPFRTLTMHRPFRTIEPTTDPIRLLFNLSAEPPAAANPPPGEETLSARPYESDPKKVFQVVGRGAKNLLKPAAEIDIQTEIGAPFALQSIKGPPT